ncbi:MAG: TolC family protein, partial [bacterium]|nr:TolC family protein [bacterium]
MLCCILQIGDIGFRFKLIALCCTLALAFLGLQPASAVQETVDVEPVDAVADAAERSRVGIDSSGVVVPALPPAEIQPLDITPQWNLKRFDVSLYKLPTDPDSMRDYLLQGYVPAEDELSLYSAVALALRYNHNLNQRRLEAASACAGISVNWANLRPQLTVQARSFAEWSRGGTTTGGGDNGSDDGEITSQLSMQLTQRIYDWGLTNKLIDQDRALYAVRVHVVEAAEQQLVFDVTAAYYQFSQALGQLRIRMDALALALEFLRQAGVRFEVGTAPRLDVIRAEARVEQARDDVTTARELLGNTAARFYSLLGVDYQRYIPAVVTPELLDLGAEPPQLDSAIEDGVISRPEVESQFATLLAGEAAVSLARNRPILEGYGSSLLQHPGRFAGTQNYELGVQLLWNAYTGGREKAERREAQLAVEAISEGIRELEDQIELDVTTSWNGLIATRSSVEASRRNLDLSAEALRAAAV